MNRLIGLLLATPLLLALLPAQAAVRASVDRPQVIEGDPVLLTLRKDGTASGERPDLTPLTRDFEIQGSSQGSQVSIVNGRRSDLTYWSVRLLPKHTGTLQIPPIRVGSEQSDPLTLKVLEVPEQTAAQPDQPLFLEMTVDHPGDRTYVQQQIPLTVRLLYRNRLQQGSLSDPAPEDAVVERLGEDRQYRTVRNGQEYNVIERHYAIFPEKSGTFRIPPVIFRGRVASASGSAAGRRRNDLFGRLFDGSPFANDPFFKDDFFSGTPFGNPGTPVRARSRALTLEVAPRPAGYRGNHWLPAEAVTLEDSWSQSPPEFRVGEPVTRTITLQAKGLEASQIPPLDLPQPDGFRLYADQPATETRTDGSGVYGISRRTYTYVPRREGPRTVPEVRLQWWDTLQGKNRETLLPPWQVQVQAGSGAAPEPPAAQTPAVTAGQPAPTAEGTTEADLGERLKQGWPWLLAALLAGLLLPLLLWWRRHRRPAAATTSAPEAPPTATRRARTRAREALKRACEQNDAHAAAIALLELAASQWPDDPPRNLGALAGRLRQGGDAVRALERTLYAPTGQPWDGQALWEAVASGLADRGPDEHAASEPLPPLYPT